MSKTDLLNRSLGLPSVKYKIEPRPEGGSWIMAEGKLPVGKLRWREWPFQWFEPLTYNVRREFQNGPVVDSLAGIELTEIAGGGTHVVSYVQLQPRHWIFAFLIKYIFGPKTKRDMNRILAHAEGYLRGEKKVIFPKLPVKNVEESALQVGLRKLGMSQRPELVGRLEAFLRETPDAQITGIRPLAVAREWKENQWKILRLFLHGTRAGLLNLRWEILCPNCRSTRDMPAESLASLKTASHCDVCQISYTGEFDKSVELKFSINPAIRPREEQTFCLAGPGGKPHIIWQAWLEAGEERTATLPPLTHPLRLRSPQVKSQFALFMADEALRNNISRIECRPDQFVITNTPDHPTPGVVKLFNPNPFPILLNWAQTDWSEDILTAARATNWQEFRDLFAREVISPNEEVTLGSQVILFTDLRGSTALYHGIGDAPAYALVRNHFAIVTKAIGENHGNVVKTIGDAVMGAFSRVDEALAAVRTCYAEIAQEQIKSPHPLLMKVSLHVGPCLAVNANDKLDFFGTTVNLASRMVDCCNGGDLSVSDELYYRPETQQFLAENKYPVESLEIRHRGFDAPHKVWRIKMN